MITIRVPTLNARLQDFSWLFTTWHQVATTDKHVRFDFTECHFLRPNAVAFLGGLARLVEHAGRNAEFAWPTITDEVFLALKKNDFAEAFGFPRYPRDGASVPFKEYRRKEKDAICQQLIEKWIGAGFVNVSQDLQGAIVGNVWEIFENAFEHSNSQVGVFSCGQFFPTLRELELAIIDFGVGIPHNVQEFNGDSHLSPQDCMRWAFQEGTSTKADSVGRGMGLDILKEFVKTNAGKLEVFSHGGYTLIEPDREAYMSRSNYFDGTLVYIRLKSDENFYQLGNVLSDFEF